VSIESRSIAIAKRFFERQGYSVKDVARGKKGRGERGCDFILTGKGRRTRVEVKGCSRKWQIPDLHHTEFNSRKRLVADKLCVVYFLPNERPKLCLIPRAVIKSSDLQPLTRYRISARIKSERVLGPYLHELPKRRYRRTWT